MEIPTEISSWLQTIVIQVEGAPISNFSIVRTVGILVLTFFCARLLFAVWKRAEQSHPNFNKSHLYVISRFSTSAIVVIGVIVALQFLGLDFSKLTMIASALSIGIGFGLKNIIDNVSSGIVLLFERSIRVGDWVIVGSTEGRVTKVNIRSTVIQTWDESEVIVPNADLITSQVTNWTLNTPSGRIHIPLGVAYGTNPELMRELLLDIATSNQEVIKGGPEPEPIVLFSGFGDSDLRFELRCFIKDIMRQRIVQSDLNLAIMRKLHDHGIEIPFPQRDLHIRDRTPIAENSDLTKL